MIAALNTQILDFGVRVITRVPGTLVLAKIADNFRNYHIVPGDNELSFTPIQILRYWNVGLTGPLAGIVKKCYTIHYMFLF